nr:MAG TPA: hypothetical protein [Microviridae sp.]
MEESEASSMQARAFTVHSKAHPEAERPAQTATTKHTAKAGHP